MGSGRQLRLSVDALPGVVYAATINAAGNGVVADSVKGEWD
jgi:hypothetical protein